MNRRHIRNMLLNSTGEAMWGFQANMVLASTVLTVLLRLYGAGERTIGAIAGIETAGVLLPQWLGIWVFRSERALKRDFFLWHIFAVCPFILAMGMTTLFAERMSPAVYRLLMLAWFSGFNFFMGVVVAAWIHWQGRVFPQQMRGLAVGAAIGASAAAGSCGALAAGALIARLSAPLSYGVLYITAWLISMLSMVFFYLIDDSSDDVSQPAEPQTISDILRWFRRSLADSNFRAYLLGRVLAGAGFAVLPFIAVHYASPAGGGLTQSMVVSAGSALAVGSAIGGFTLGRLGDVRGHRLGVMLGVAAQIVALMGMIFVPGMAGCVVAYFFAGICTMGTWPCHFNFLIETCPHEGRMAHIAVGNAFIGAATCLMPVIAGQIAGNLGTTRLFIISAALSVAALLWIVGWVEEPRARAVKTGD